MRGTLRFKIADQPWELAAIHRLNYQTFVEEIPQHSPNERRALIDKFNAGNTYVIALRGRELVGMVTVRGERPFSLDAKLADLDAHLPRGRRVCEIRLLATQPRERHGRVFAGMIQLLARHCVDRGYDLAVISGTTRQLKLYRHMGFVPFGPLVGKEGALYQPMYLTLEAFTPASRAIAPVETDPHVHGLSRINFLPGPVDVSPQVWRAFTAPSVSHRSEQFVRDFTATRRLLCDLTRARHVQILSGSGTLANDAVAAQLSLLGGRGLILVNGEFGERLVQQASRMRLAFETIRIPWGEAFDAKSVRERLLRQRRMRPFDWLWAVHCETSTGVLNDLSMLKDACRGAETRLCLDCVSSIGPAQLDLSGVYLASASSSKGLAAIAGLAIVFHDHPIEPSARIPKYLDLGVYDAADSVPFTINSHLVYALKAARELAPRDQVQATAQLARHLRGRLREAGFSLVADDSITLPAVTTIALDESLRSAEIGARLERQGMLVSYRSEYLLERNWVQICLYGRSARCDVDHVVDALRSSLRRGSRRVARSLARPLESVPVH